MSSAKRPLLIASCASGTGLAEDINVYIKNNQIFNEDNSSIQVLYDIDFQFSDGETCVRLEHDVNGKEIFLIQRIKDPNVERTLNDNYLAFIIAVRAFREWGANLITGILPYLPYARQDKPTSGKREPITAKLMADLSREAGLDRLVVWAPHDKRVQGFYGKIPVDGISPNHLFCDLFHAFHSNEQVIGVAPDEGAAALMIPFCRQMNIRCAVASKYRPKPEQAKITEIMGNFEGITTAIVLDDMINTGGTINETIKYIVENKGVKKVFLGVSHFLGNPQAIQRLKDLHDTHHLEHIYVTNSVPLSRTFTELGFTSVISLAPSISNAIKGILCNQTLYEIFP